MAGPDEATGSWDPEQGTQALARLRGEARRVTPEQWRTLFRQLRQAAEGLALHPFVRGDAEAEARLARALMSEDLAALDAGIDHLADYIDAKLAFRAALRGQAAPPAPAVRGPGTATAARAAARQGPSGDDFAPPAPDGGTPATRPRRAVIRL